MIFVGRDALWVAYHPLSFDDLLAKYPLRSTRQTWLGKVHGYGVQAIAVNPEGSLVAALLRYRKGPRSPRHQRDRRNIG